MRIRRLHEWNLPTREAAQLQLDLAPCVEREGEPESVLYIAGVDVRSPVVARGDGCAAVVVMKYPDMEIVETRVAQGHIDFPYVPGLLSFRELPLVAQAFEMLQTVPDLVIVDGQGIAHPRRFGIAAHLGVLLDIPTIGCAKSKLIGEYEEPATDAGSWSPLTDGNEVIGAAVRTRTGVKPVFVSVGNKIGLDAAIHWVLACCRGYRLPEPARMAHLAANGRLAVTDCLVEAGV